MSSERETYPGLRVLLVEDYCLTRELTQDILEFMQCDVTVAETGPEALELFKSETFDLVLLDIKIPVINGIDVAKEMRQFEESTEKDKTPIVALTANPDHENAEACFNAGMDEYVNKPINYDVLQRIIKDFVNKEPAEEKED